MATPKRLIGLLLVVLLALSAGVTSAQGDSVIVIGFDQEAPQLYPMVSMVQAGMLENFYARDVWDWDTNLEIYPIMVSEIPSFDNGMVTALDNGNTQVTYKLREGMKWSDGEAVTSADCAFWHEVLMNPTASANVTRGNYPNVVESLEVVDDLTFVLTYNTPWPDYLGDTSAIAVCRYPEHVLRPVLEAEGTLDNSDYWAGNGVVGYGPWKFESWTVGDSMSFVRNENWDGQQPAIDRVIAKFIPDSAQLVNALQNGEIDMAFLFQDNLVPSYQEIPGVEVWSTGGVLADALWVNTGFPDAEVNKAHPALSDVRVRKAIAHAMDRQTMLDGLVGPNQEAPRNWYSNVWWPENLEYLDYNVDTANALLDESGWVDSNGNGIRDKDGVELILRFYTTTRQQRMDYQLLIQQYLQTVGISTQVFAVPAGPLFDTYVNRGILDSHDFDLAIFASTNNPVSPNGSVQDFQCSGVGTPDNPNGSNKTGFCNPEYDRLDNLVQVTVDPEERAGYVAEAVTLFNEGYFWFGLTPRPTWYALAGDRFDSSTFQDLGVLSSNYFNKAEFWAPK